MKLLIDTNILIDYVCHRGEFYNAARNVFETALTGDNELLLTDLSYMNCLYVAKHYNIEEKALIKALLAIQKQCGLAEINNDVISAALTSDWKDKEDALQYEAALASNADGIVTRNVKDFHKSQIQIFTTADIQ